MLATQQAELNRDRKKQKRPFSIEDFYCYQSEEDKDSIDVIYGITAMELIKIRKFPNWGLFVYKELASSAEKGKGSKLPEVLCYQSDNVILMAPQISDGVCRCMLIALESASNCVVHLTSPCGKEIKARIPELRSKVTATENCYLDVY